MNFDGQKNISWTIGQTIIGTVSSSDFVFTQGFHQPPDPASTSFYSPHFTYEIKVFPNPVSNFLRIETQYNEVLKIEVFDMIGQRLFSSEFLHNEAIDVSRFEPGMYLISLFHSDGLAASIAFQKY